MQNAQFSVASMREYRNISKLFRLFGFRRHLNLKIKLGVAKTAIIYPEVKP
jgi:hypothetical protein